MIPNWQNPNGITWSFLALQKWLLKRSFFAWAYRQGGIDAFPLAQKDVLETMRDDLDKQADELAKKKLNDLLSPVDQLSIISLDKRAGAIYIGGVKAEVTQLQNLKSEAAFLLESELWKLLCETPKELAQRAMFVDGKSIEELQKGRSMLYLLSTQERILSILQQVIHTPS